MSADDNSGGGTDATIVWRLATSGTFTIEATSSVGGATGSYAVGLTTNLIANGGFNLGVWNPWVIANSRAALVTTSPQAGRYCVKLLGVGTTGSTWLRQAPGFPRGSGARTLRFWLKIASAETSTTTASDVLRVRIKNGAGTTLTTLALFSNVHKTTYGNWRQVSVTIPAAYAVAGNHLWFEASENASVPTTFFIDTVSIQ